MCVKLIICASIMAIYHANGALLLWSNHKLEVSPLKSFGDENFEELVADLGYPEVTIYRSPSLSLLPGLKELLSGYYTAYSPNGDINTENATDISGQDDLALIKTKQELESSRDNTLSVIVLPTGRSKREIISSSSSTTTESPTSMPYKLPKGPVFYKGQSKKDNTYGLLYSSQPLLLKTNSSLLLGITSPDMISVDTINRDSYTRLNIKIPVEEDNSVILRFIFAWSSSNYWSLTSVKISYTNPIYLFNLSIEQEVSAPAHFSHHCNGETVFSDSNNAVELYIYDLQTQIDSKDGSFGDAYDCVNFTSGPIWSGLFVTAILGVGMMVALIAISGIKAMDKFDNQKTKQLVITIIE